MITYLCAILFPRPVSEDDFIRALPEAINPRGSGGRSWRFAYESDKPKAEFERWLRQKAVRTGQIVMVMTISHERGGTTFTELRVCADCTAGVSNDDWTHLDFFHAPLVADGKLVTIKERLTDLGWMTHVRVVEEPGNFTCGVCGDPLTEASSSIFEYKTKEGTDGQKS